MTKRTERVNALLQEELSELLRRDLHDPRIGGVVTITHVEVAPDLRTARAWVSVYGSEEERSGTMAALEHARPFVRRLLGKRLHMRNTPDVRFISDDSLERAQALTDLMRKNAEERGESV